jgi:hypothetical protein
MAEITPLACRCGAVRLEVEKAPMISAECYCDSCRSAGERLGALPGTAPMLNDKGGTPYALYRKDRVRFVAGEELMRGFRLKPDSPTRRVVASCCNTPLFAEFQNGHWLSMYAALWPEAERPAMQLRTMTSDLPPAVKLDDRLPNARHQNFAFFVALLGAWAAMGFKVPKLDISEGGIDA